jgi:hypothetical protein
LGDRNLSPKLGTSHLVLAHRNLDQTAFRAAFRQNSWHGHSHNSSRKGSMLANMVWALKSNEGHCIQLHYKPPCGKNLSGILTQWSYDYYAIDSYLYIHVCGYRPFLPRKITKTSAANPQQANQVCITKPLNLRPLNQKPYPSHAIPFIRIQPKRKDDAGG